MGVRSGLQRDQQGRCHLVHSSIKHQPDLRQDIMASRGDPLSLHLGDQCLSSGHLIGDHNINSSVDHSSSSLGLFSRTDQDSRLVGRHLLLRVPGLLGRRRGVGHVGSHTTSVTALWRGLEHQISWTHYHGRYGQGPSDSCSGE
jgi:hypothetical protein